MVGFWAILEKVGPGQTIASSKSKYTCPCRRIIFIGKTRRVTLQIRWHVFVTCCRFIVNRLSIRRKFDVNWCIIVVNPLWLVSQFVANSLQKKVFVSCCSCRDSCLSIHCKIRFRPFVTCCQFIVNCFSTRVQCVVKCVIFVVKPLLITYLSLQIHCHVFVSCC